VLAHLTTLADIHTLYDGDYEGRRDIAVAEATFESMQRGDEIIYQGVLRDAETRTADLEGECMTTVGSLALLTKDSVLAALAEFDRSGRDRFLEEHGFGSARSYFIVHDDREYDSKAIAGVAHGYARPDLGPLSAEEFSGGETTVAHRLAQLGFEVVRRMSSRRNPPWSEEELVLALDLYLREGMLDSADPLALQLSARLNALVVHSVRPDEERFRNPNGVALKLANLAAIDPTYPGVGMRRGGKRDRDVWARYAADEDALAAAVEQVLAGLTLDSIALVRSKPTALARVELEAFESEDFDSRVEGGLFRRTRHEQRLVHDYGAHLEARGHAVGRHRYPLLVGVRNLSCDLFDETQSRLYEAKASSRREAVRMAIGQLYDYRRFEDSPAAVKLAVLLPRRPADDLLELLGSLNIGVAWRVGKGFDEQGL